MIIDGQEIKIRRAISVLRAAQEAGIYIPALCDHPDLAPCGHCGLCVVEIEGDGCFRACMTTANEDMIVKTDTLEVRRQRQEALEAILLEHPHACLDCWRRERCDPGNICLRSVAVAQHCVYCPKNGHCELQRVVDYVGISRDIPYRPKGYSIQTENPFFYRDYNLCIVCGRCVRICRDVRGIGVYALDDEQKPSRVVTTKGESTIDSGCRFCLACVEVCPTAAIVDRDLRNCVRTRMPLLFPAAIHVRPT